MDWFEEGERAGAGGGGGLSRLTQAVFKGGQKRTNVRFAAWFEEGASWVCFYVIFYGGHVHSHAQAVHPFRFQDLPVSAPRFVLLSPCATGLLTRLGLILSLPFRRVLPFLLLVFSRLSVFRVSCFVLSRCGTSGFVAPEILKAGKQEGYGMNVDIFSVRPLQKL